MFKKSKTKQIKMIIINILSFKTTKQTIKNKLIKKL